MLLQHIRTKEVLTGIWSVYKREPVLAGLKQEYVFIRYISTDILMNGFYMPFILTLLKLRIVCRRSYKSADSWPNIPDNAWLI